MTKVEEISIAEIEYILDILSKRIDISDIDSKALNNLVLAIAIASRRGDMRVEEIVNNLEEGEHTIKYKGWLEILKKPITYYGSFTRGLVPIRVNLEEGTYELLSKKAKKVAEVKDEDKLLEELKKSIALIKKKKEKLMKKIS